eukprot:scaffold282119_cov10-Tisochrysis_lutea.AAC.1
MSSSTRGCKWASCDTFQTRRISCAALAGKAGGACKPLPSLDLLLSLFGLTPAAAAVAGSPCPPGCVSLGGSQLASHPVWLAC